MPKNTACAHMRLLLVTALWGATLPIIHDFDANYSSVLFVFLRFAIAAIVMFPFIYRKINLSDMGSLKYGFILGVINSCIYLFQTTSLKTISSPHAAFILSVYVILVPILLPIFGFRKPKIIECVAAIICLYGVYILNGTKISTLKIGDAWIIASAVSVAISMIIIAIAITKVKSILLFSFYQIIFSTFLPLIILIYHPVTIPHTIGFWISVGYCALFATVIAFTLQLKYQSQVGASKAALIFSLEAVFASIIACLMGETISMRIIVGGVIILLSVMFIDIVNSVNYKSQSNLS